MRCLKELSVISTLEKLRGLLVVYVGDFSLQAPEGTLRNAFLEKLGTILKLGKEVTLSGQSSLTFLGIDILMKESGDVFLHLERFVDSLSDKYSMQCCKDNKCMQIDRLPTEPGVPITPGLRQLQP